MDSSNNQFYIRARAAILDNEKFLVVKHSEDTDYYALPGGHVEWSENPKECLEREIIEELGIKPTIGKLLYINTFTEKNHHSVEFIFEVTNGCDFQCIEKLGGTHKHELFDIRWVNKDDGVRILPEEIQKDFENNTILNNNLKFIS